MILRTINDEPPKLSNEPHWDESFKEFISFCLVKDPTKRYKSLKPLSYRNRKSADDLLKLCKVFFSKSKGPEYIKEKLLKDFNPANRKVNKNYLTILTPL